MVTRWLTGLLVIAASVGLAWVGSYVWLALVMCFLAIASFEWGNLAGVSGWLLLLVLIPSAVMMVFGYFTYVPFALVPPACAMLISQDPEDVLGMIWGGAGIVWLALPAALLFQLRLHFGFAPLLVLLAGTALQDTFALYIGRFFGSDRPFTPVISPRKTWAGFFGNIVGMVGTLLVAGFYLHWPWGYTLAGGVALGLAGQIGDLSISGLKRRADVKDTGTFFPGHGGILDRVDGLLFNVVVFYPFCLILRDLT